MVREEFNNNIKIRSWLGFLLSVAIIIMVASLSSVIRIRLDLTEDQRYTLSDSTKVILSNLKDDIFIQVFLDGDIPIPLKRLKRSVEDMLDEFRIASGYLIDFEFINPSEEKDIKQRETQYQYLINKGLSPVNIQAADDEGGSTQKIIFPGMLVNYNGIEVPVNFLENNPLIPYEQNILHSAEGLEYEMIQTIATLSSDTIYKVAFIEGHDEISEIETADITLNLARYFTIDRGVIGGTPGVLDQYAAVVIAGPEIEFGEADKLVLDQYIMNGGKVLWLIDEVSVNSDSLVTGTTVGLYRPLNIEDQLFWYGARINPVLVQDIESWYIRLQVSSGSNNQQIVPAPWLYYPLLNPSSGHPVTRNLNKVKGEYTNYIDTVGMNQAVHKKILLSTSQFSRLMTPPVLIRLKDAESLPDEKNFNQSNLPVAVLLEGKFPSAFKNRMIEKIISDTDFKVKEESTSTKMIIVADADIIRNGVQRVGLDEMPLPLGQDRYTLQMFGNRDFIVNCINYLVDDHGIMELRSRELKLRFLNTPKVKSEKIKWQLINLFGPVLIVILAGLVYSYFRKKIYTRY